MEREREEESGEMYSLNESGEYTLCGDVPNFTVQGLQDALTEAESAVTEPPPPADEFIIQLEVTMADQPGRPHPPAYSWNGGLVRHILKSDPALRDLEHVQADGPGLTYLFFHDRHRYRGLSKRKLWLCALTFQMLLPSGLGGLHTLMRSLYCWKQDGSVQQPCKKSAGNVFDLLKNLFYLCM